MTMDLARESAPSVDYLILGSGLAGLTFGALMAQKGHRVEVVEAHEFLGGYGHTFAQGDYKFNAQLHYVVGCGEGGAVNTVLKKLNLDQTVLFTKLDAQGYDRVYCEGQQLNIPYTLSKLQENMFALDASPKAQQAVKKFIELLEIFSQVSARFPRHMRHSYKMLPVIPSIIKLLPYKKATLQEVFDACELPPLLQTLVCGQLLDYLLPPKSLSFFIWAALFTGYSKGAYYPINHFDSVVEALAKRIQEHNGSIATNTKVVQFIKEKNAIIGVQTQAVDPKTGIEFGPKINRHAKKVICNFDPKQAANMIGMNHFSKKLQKQLDYDYSGSSFVLYGVVKDIDLRDYGFGSWNIWHCPLNLNDAFDAMLNEQDYSDPYFAMNSCSLHTGVDKSHCPHENEQIFQMITVADYDYWAHLKMRDRNTYNQKKREVFESLLDVVDKKYIPNIRKHISFKMTGSPTTNERYVLAPKGGCYGVNLTPRNFEFSRKLGTSSSIDNLYFCSAAAGCGGFGGAIMTGLSLYETLTKDYLG